MELDSFSAIIKECLKYDVKFPPTEEKIKAHREAIDEIVQNEEGKCADFKKKFQLKMKLYNDPLHGSIQLNPLEDAIVNTPEFYRLREIKQLGGKSHVFPGAVHTRFEHSIGVCYLAGKLFKHLKERSHPEGLTDQDELCVRLAGLCHDLGHGPFSHLFDGVMKKIAADKVERAWCSLVQCTQDLDTPLGHGPFSHLFDGEMQKTAADEVERALCSLVQCTQDLDTPLGHGPFSLLFEGVMKDIAADEKFEVRKHEEISVMVFKRILLEHHEILIMFEKCGLTGKHVEMIGEMINCSDEVMEKADKKKKYLYEIVANKKSGMDVDKWDYFARDCHHLGLKNEFDMERCIVLSSIVEKDGEYHVGFREKEKRNIYGMFRTRCVLYQKAYNHKIADGIDMMIKDALYHASDIPLRLPQFDKQEDLPLGATSLRRIIRCAMKENDLSGYIQLTDSILRILMLIPSSGTELKKVQLLIRRIAKRDIYKPLCEHSYFSDEYESPLKHKDLKNGDKFLSYDLDEFEIENLAIKYASEESEDPVADNMYFFEKNESETAIPTVVAGTSGDTPGEERRIKSESKLNLPRAFIEYRISLYSKNFKQLSKEDKSRIKNEFGVHVSTIMAKLKKSADEAVQVPEPPSQNN